MNKILDGKSVAEAIKSELSVEIERLKAHGIAPGLAAVLVGDNPASEIYVNSKAKQCRAIGIYSEVIRRPRELPEAELIELVRSLNDRSDIHGILVQEPLPPQIRKLRITMSVDPRKDVDGFHPENLGRILIGEPRFLTCTPYGVIELLRRSNLTLEKQHVVILGRSNIVGKPLAAMLLQKWPYTNCTVTVCHTGTPDPARFTREADVVVCAMGVPEFLRGDMIKAGAVVVDVGVNRISDPSTKSGHRLVGDAHFESCLERCSHITPVPGGIGPMTIAMLLVNTVKACRLIHRVE